MAEAFTPDGDVRADGVEPQKADPTPQGAKPGVSRAWSKSDPRVVIKKYANRRLYNTGSSSYVTLDHLSDLVKEGVDFVVFDAKTNEDITRQVLTQIIFEAENSGQNLLPIQFLRQLIQLYGNQMQSLVPGYLEMSLDAFARQQERMREQLGGPMKSVQPYRMFEEQVRQNLALFGQAMKMFTPFVPLRADEGGARPDSPPRPEPAAHPAESAADSLAELRVRMEDMQRQIEQLAAGKT